MCCTVVFTCCCTICGINFECDRISILKHTLDNFTNVCDLSTEKFNRIFYLKLAVSTNDCSYICLLTTHCCIERCLINNNSSTLTVCKCCNHITLSCKCSDFSICLKSVISDKLCRKCRIKLLVNSLFCSHVVCSLSCAAGFLLLFFHSSFKAFLIYRVSFFLKDFSSEVYRESISVI